MTPKDIQEFDNSDLARTAVSTLGLYMDKSVRGTPTQAEYCLVHDYLLTSICIESHGVSVPNILLLSRFEIMT